MPSFGPIGSAPVSSDGNVSAGGGAPSFSLDVSTTNTLGPQTVTATFSGVDAPASNPFSEAVAFASLGSYSVQSQFVATFSLNVTSLGGAIQIDCSTTSTSRTITAAASAPDAPTVSAENTNKGTIEVTITPGASDGGASVDGYTASRSGWTDLNAGETTLTHILSGGTLYESGTVDVVAHNTAGNSAAGTSSAVIATKRGRYYFPYPIDHTKFPATLTGFHVPVDITDDDGELKLVANGGKVTSASGYDIGFFEDEAGTVPLQWEIESYDGVAGRVVGWVSVDGNATTDVDVYVFFGNSLISTAQNTATAVWDSNYKIVQHLPTVDDPFVYPTRTGSVLIDVAPGTWKECQVYDLIKVDDPTDPTKLIYFFSGMAARGGDVQGHQATGRATALKATPTVITEYVSNPVIPWTTGWGRRLCFVWVDPADNKFYGYCVYAADFDGNGEIELWTSEDLGFTWTNEGAAITPTGQGRNDSTTMTADCCGFDATDSEDGYYYIIYNIIVAGAQNKTRLARSASRAGPWEKIQAYDSADDIIIGGVQEGEVDELFQEFQCGVKRTGVYIRLCEVNDGVHWTIGAHTATNIRGPWVRSGIAPIFRHTGNGADFDGVHIATPFIMDINGVDWLGYCGCNPADPNDWGTSFWKISMASLSGPLEAVGTRQLLDSTSNANHMVPMGSTAVAGEIGGGLSFDGLTEFLGTSTVAMTATNDFTIEFWVQLAILTQFGSIMQCGANNSAGGTGWSVLLTNAAVDGAGARLSMNVSGVAFMVSNYDFADTDWHKVVFQRTAGTWTLKVDNVSKTLTNNTSTPSAPAARFTIGSGIAWSPFVGAVDEVRLSDSVRTANWLTAAYNFEADPTDSGTLGSESDTGLPVLTAEAIVISGDSSGVGGTPVTLTIGANGTFSGTLTGSLAYAGGTLSTYSYSITDGSTQEVIATPTALGSNNVTSSGQSGGLTEASFAYTATAETISLGGASSANRAVQSAAITVTLDAPAHANTTVTGGTSGTGTFSGTSIVPAGQTTGSPSLFYTGTVSGAVNLSTTNGGGMTNASGYSFTVNVVREASFGGTGASGLRKPGIIAGGKTITINLIDDTFVAAGATFDGQRQGLIDALVAAASPSGGWNAQVTPALQVTDVVRTGPATATLTLPAVAGYTYSSPERLTMLLDDAVLTGAALAVSGAIRINAPAIGGERASRSRSSRGR